MIRTAFALIVLSAAAFAADAPLLSLVDPGAKVIGGMHVDRTLASPLGRYLLSQMNDDDAEFRKFIDMTGFDPRTDVREVVMASSDTTRKSGFVAARGVFNGPRILELAKSHGGLATSYNGVPVVSSKQGQWLAILDGATALMGDQALVKYAIDHRGATAVPATAMLQKATGLANLHDGWMVTMGTIMPPVGTKGTPMPTGAALAGILETSGGINFGSMVRVSGEALTRSDKDAQALVDVIRFIATMALNSSQTNPETQKFEAILNSLDVKSEAATVKLSFSVAEADLEQIIKPKRATTKRASVK
jgi:hypothetical protein